MIFVMSAKVKEDDAELYIVQVHDNGLKRNQATNRLIALLNLFIFFKKKPQENSTLYES